jgi:hypothetical protein
LHNRFGLNETIVEDVDLPVQRTTAREHAGV